MKNAIVCLAVLAGCADSELTTSSGNAELGIARFEVQDTDYKTTITGLDASGVEVGRLELVHGVFTLSSMFKDDYATPQIDGRKLDVRVGSEQLVWETGGYDPVMQLPAHPEYEVLLPIFLADPHVNSVLERWGIGFADSEESSYALVQGADFGTNLTTCNGATSCGTAYYGTVNLCGGGNPSNMASRITQTPGTHCGLYSSTYDQAVVQQCCPADGVNASWPWFGRKACPTTSSNSTMCGTRTSGACKACPGYPDTQGYCNVSATTAGTCGGTIYKLGFTYGRCAAEAEHCVSNRDCCVGMFCDPNWNNTCVYQ